MIAVLFFFFPHRRPLASSRVPEVPKNACPSSVDLCQWWSKIVQPDPTFTFSSQVVLRETTSQVSTFNPLIQIITPLSLLNTCISWCDINSTVPRILGYVRSACAH
ncbi:hypothetical protein P167DRAFT_47164 [Morchella conica CCBAS932]|uniref:Uncharacterized protein n=1 Tax=Morchella conica CCBAS932 TaxID=1392247 RepID=A0A3N4KWC1_9PEZI|nr:hypothetical protein P167DRAFT_47164 [Morchella conica CCBAS932]